MDENSSSTPASSGGSDKNKMMYVAVAGVVVLVLLSGAGYAFRHELRAMLMPGSAVQTETSAPTPAPQTAEPPAPALTNETPAAIMEAEVDYTDSGFGPASVTIKKGGMVKFLNKTTGAMSVASNPHPVHTDYPGFDQGKSTSKGKDEYDFIFTKVGTWGYHNHAKASDGGTVVVTP